MVKGRYELRFVDQKNNFLSFLRNFFSLYPKRKWVALAIAIFVWGLVVGQKQITMEKNVVLKYQVKDGLEILDPVKVVKVKISGSSMDLRKFDDVSKSLLINISDYSMEGDYFVEVPMQKLSEISGVKVLSIIPTRVPIVLKVKQK